MKREASDRLKRNEPRLARVLVTTDPDLIARIKKIGEGVKAGKPVSSFNRKVTEVVRRLAPAAPKHVPAV
ncbi:MAG: YhcN/YlaJ family sporulation lipoprotein [Moorellales bacterium]